MNRETVIQNIKRLCTHKNIPISQLEKNIGVSPGFLTRMSTSYPSVDKVAAAAKYLEVSIDFLCNATLTDDNLLHNTFAEILAQRTLYKTVQWVKIVKNDARYNMINNLDILKSNRGENINYDTGETYDDLDQDLFIYFTSESDLDIYYVYQIVCVNFDDEVYSNYNEYSYVLINVDHANSFLDVDENIIKELRNNIEMVLYKEPQKEKIKNILENFIKKE